MKLKNRILKKIMPLPQGAGELPLHAGEVYYLWEGLTSGYKLIEMVETYLMNTDDTTIRMYLKGLTTSTYLLKIRKFEQFLKEEGFTVPPLPASKIKQGPPGLFAEVLLTDKDVVRNILSIGEAYVSMNARAIVTCIKDSVRNLFKDMMGDHIKAYKIFKDLGKNRNLIDLPPPISGRKDSLNVNEVSVLWEELSKRYSSQVNMETYLVSTKDMDLVNLINWGLKEIVMPQMENLENKLTNEGITVPPRPVQRKGQLPQHRVSKIRASDDEVIGVLSLAFQQAVLVHARAITAVDKEDLFNMFNDFLYKEIEGFEKLLTLAKKRKALLNPPIVSSRPI